MISRQPSAGKTYLPVMTKKTFSNSARLTCGVLLAGLLLAVAGCGDKSAKLTASESNAFAGAPAEVKQQWDKALAADKARDYAAAQTLLDALTQASLNESQKAALEKERADFGQRLWAAAEKNDPAAVKAVENSHKSRNQKNRGLPAR